MPWHELKLKLKKLKRNFCFLSLFSGPDLHCFSAVVRVETEDGFSVLQHLVHCGDIGPAFQISYMAANVAFSKAVLACLIELLRLYSPVKICFFMPK